MIDFIKFKGKIYKKISNSTNYALCAFFDKDEGCYRFSDICFDEQDKRKCFIIQNLNVIEWMDYLEQNNLL